MNRPKSTLAQAALLFVLFLPVSRASHPLPSPESIKAITQRVADWQMEHFHEQGKFRALSKGELNRWRHRRNYHDLEWHLGALYTGMFQWSTVAGDSKYTEWLTDIGERNGWNLHRRPYHADDHAVGQFYLKLYEQSGDERMIVPTRERFDWILENPRNGTLEWTANPTDAHKRWGWCDALFMAPPVWARLAKVTGEPKYLDFMDREYHATFALLWDQEEHLFWRDSSFFERREGNGQKLFWARGNGWVFGGLALMIPDLPEDWEGRRFYVNLFRQMADKLKSIQRTDGTWSSGLLGGEEGYPIKEASGTSFFTFGLAWGVNNGLLDRATYEPIILKAWDTLTGCVTEEGLLGYVQPVGAAPDDSFPDKTEVYAVGAFLAAGSEVCKLVGGDTKSKGACSSNTPITFMKDGGWCWYQDPRAIIQNRKLVVGGVSGLSGDVKVSVYDLAESVDLGTLVLHKDFERDDHDAPAFHARPDGSLLAMWAKHGREKMHYYRISSPDDYLDWGERQQIDYTYPDKRGVTYMNLYAIAKEGQLYNFYRDGETFNPSFVASTDHGDTWGDRTHFLADEVGGRQRPYARYLQRGAHTIGVSFTDAHPRGYGNSLYYADFRDGAFFRVDGTKIKDLTDGPLTTSEAEKIYEGSETKEKPKGWDSVPNSAWTCATAVDEKAYPHIGYTLFQSHTDHRFRLASWTGEIWNDREVAYAGKCLYDRESSYTGLMAFDPGDPRHVYISSDVDPATGGDSGGKHEIYTARIEAKDDIQSIEWKALTSGSSHRQIRPIVVSNEGYTVLLWLSGPWNTYMDYASDVVGIVLDRP